MTNNIGDGGGVRGGMMSSRRLVPRMPLMNGRKERDHEDLILFRELQKREKERNVVSLLQPVSDEFEPTGNYQLYRIASAKKGSGFEFLTDQNNKNDYDWLKTPPASPLFPSLEMDTNNSELVVQREISSLQPLSRFAGGHCNSDGTVEARNHDGRPKSPNPKPKVCPEVGERSRMMRCATPTLTLNPTPTPSTSPTDHRRTSCKMASISAVSVSPTVVHTKHSVSSSSEAIHNHLKGQKGARLMNTKTSASNKYQKDEAFQTRPKRSAATNSSNNNNDIVLVATANKSSTSSAIDHVNQKDIVYSSMAAAAGGAGGGVVGVKSKGNESKSKPTASTCSSSTRGGRTSPNYLIKARSRSTAKTATEIAAGFCNEELLPNLRTEQRPNSASATRGRSQVPGSVSKVASMIFQPGGGGCGASAAVVTRRKSCSPSASRDRKVVLVAEQTNLQQGQQQQHPMAAAGLKGKIQTGNGTQVLGSRMVQRVMNARKAATHPHHPHQDKDQKKQTTASRGF